MPIYEYYCPDNHKIYQFYAKTLAQGKRVPRCPENAALRMVKLVSGFAVVGKAREKAPAAPAEGSAGDARMEGAADAMEREFAGVDENDPRAMGRMMRRMAELTGEPIAGEMEEVVRKLEEGTDPDSLDEALGGVDDGEAGGEGDGPSPAASPGEPGPKAKLRPRPGPPARDPKLYDYD